MAPKLDLEARMTIKTLKERGSTAGSIARTLGVTEGAVRYHLRRQAAAVEDGRAKQRHLAADWDAAIVAWLAGRGEGTPTNLAALHAWLVSEHDFPGSLRSVQRYFRACFPRPRRRARRRVETPPSLGALPDLPEPFDLVATRRVADDCTVAFEGRRYSVPFRFVGRTVELRGCAGRVQVVAEARVVAEHERHTDRLLVIEPAHFEGEATADVLPPQPLGRMGRRLQEIAALVPERRPLDLYAELAEVAR